MYAGDLGVWGFGGLHMYGILGFGDLGIWGIAHVWDLGVWGFGGLHMYGIWGFLMIVGALCK